MNQANMMTVGDFSSKGTIVKRIKEENWEEIVKIVQKINLEDKKTILSFGTDVTSNLSNYADEVLKVIRVIDMNDVSTIMTDLNSIISRFDSADFTKVPEKKGFLETVFKKAKQTIEDVFNRYDVMSNDVESLYIKLKNYEANAYKSDVVLDKLKDELKKTYINLQKYIVASEVAIEELSTKVIPFQLETIEQDESDVLAKMKLKELEDVKKSLELKLNNFKTSEITTLQFLEMVEGVKEGNNTTVEKVNSSVIATLPVFKTNLVLAIEARRTFVTNKSLQSLDEVTGQIMLDGAKMIVESQRTSHELSTKPIISIEKLIEIQNVLYEGAKEIKESESKYLQTLRQNDIRLEELKNKMLSITQ